ncbi:MAG: CinA family nicotinamide mononucleotide deamidase-related protein [Phycisphaerae bacterium]|nr:CinA family nicotinamide mononucleotide deamidase-related protein [Phycisphaerae bacterium]MBT6269098.1 CinA family nicotinamide mononucleotide deamidase-related protein [Phycisphaerae bacterium]MBT6282686.1 CinA family nicotinamide mononucleotide deamidase-related protein [Phycisphaerae bacterium]
MSANVSILTIGDELILGDRIDTNGPWLSRAMLSCGIKTVERRCVSDGIENIVEALQAVVGKSDVCILTGGLGPTEDDRTRKALAKALGEPLVQDEGALASIENWFSKAGLTMPSPNAVQALRPVSATWIENKHGTAPGLIASIENCMVLCLPEPPSELKPMFESVKNKVTEQLDCAVPLQTVELHAWGIAESIAGEKIKDIMQVEDPSVSILMGSSGITARVTSSDEQKRNAVAKEIECRWSPWVFGFESETLSSSLGKLVDGSIAIAESCTAGLVGDLIASTPGSSTWLSGGWITYTNALKSSQLGVAKALIEEFGAVSAEVAKAMCEGAAKSSGATIGLSTTGIAGPSGGTESKPVGTVFIGCTINGETQVRAFIFTGTRNEIRRRAANSALQMVRLLLIGKEAESMCWQHRDIQL